MNELLSQIEDSPALVGILTAIGVIVISVIGFFLKRKFFTNKKNSAPRIQAGGSISAGGDITAGNKTISTTTNIHGSSAHNIETFKNYVRDYNWNKEFINHKEFWICEHDSSFQIEISHEPEEFSEEWTQVYPASNQSSKRDIYLVINGSRIKSYIFVSADGGRIFVPLPRKEVDEKGTVKYYWESNSLDFQIGKIIGEFYIYKSIEKIAERSTIEIR